MRPSESASCAILFKILTSNLLFIQGWTLKGHHCARVFQKPLPWREAQEDCQLQGGNLGSDRK